MPKLTKTFIDKVSAPAESYQIHWDDSIKGYGLRVTSAGKRVFVAQGRVMNKAVCFTIGPYGEFTEHEAREKARRVLQGMREGKDPRDAKKQDAAAKVTLREVADAYKNRPGKLKDSSKAAIDRLVRTTFAAWQDKPIITITEEDCRRRYHEMLTKGLRGKAPAPGQAVQAFSVLRALINFASRRLKKADGSPLISYNPVSVLKDDWVTLPERKSRIPESKIGAVWNALEQWREVAYNRDTLASIELILFLMLTGARIGEASALTWDRVSLCDEDAWWHLPDPKNRNPVWLPLSTQAVELLRARPKVEGSNFVFASWGASGHLKDPRDMMKKVSDVAGTKITPHDLRRSFTTFGVASCDIDLHKIELLTNHVPRGVTAKHYLETSHLQYLRPEVQRISDWIESKAHTARAMATGQNVVPLRA
jgi:integrase